MQIHPTWWAWRRPGARLCGQEGRGCRQGSRAPLSAAQHSTSEQKPLSTAARPAAATLRLPERLSSMLQHINLNPSAARIHPSPPHSSRSRSSSSRTPAASHHHAGPPAFPHTLAQSRTTPPERCRTCPSQPASDAASAAPHRPRTHAHTAWGQGQGVQPVAVAVCPCPDAGTCEQYACRTRQLSSHLIYVHVTFTWPACKVPGCCAQPRISHARSAQYGHLLSAASAPCCVLGSSTVISTAATSMRNVTPVLLKAALPQKMHQPAAINSALNTCMRTLPFACSSTG